MIASVVAILDSEHAREEVLRAIANLPGVEIGNAAPVAHRIPITIELPDSAGLDAATQLLQQCPGVAFVDVVFVYLENDTAGSPGSAVSSDAKANAL
jgi:nitrate reductase NapAB chaperone NapD